MAKQKRFDKLPTVIEAVLISVIIGGLIFLAVWFLT